MGVAREDKSDRSFIIVQAIPVRCEESRKQNEACLVNGTCVETLCLKVCHMQHEKHTFHVKL